MRGAAAAQRSLDLLEMLRERTAGNLTESERELLWSALWTLRARLAASGAGEALPMAAVEPWEDGA